MAQTKVKLISDGVIVQSNLHSSHGITTAHIGEGSNLYYTDARVGSYLSTNSFATESYVGTQITNLVDSSPATLNTLNELAAALGDDPNFATTTATSIGLKAPLASPSFTGAVTIPGAISAGANGGLRIHSSGTKFFNVTAANAARNNIMDIGAADAKFKDLYLGGKILVGTGATAAATINAYSTAVSTGLYSALRVIEHGSASSYWDIGATNAANTLLNFYHNGSTTPKIIFTHVGGATFAGNVLIGQTAAVGTSVLQAEGSTNAIIRMNSTSGTGGRMDFAHGGSNYGNVGSTRNMLGVGNATDMMVNGDSILYLGVGAQHMTINSAGNVGIGTTSPTQGKVDILDAGAYSAHTGHGLTINSNANNAYTSMYMGADDSIDAIYIQSAGRNTSFTSKKLLLNPNGGNVGIGTTSPQSNLDIKGSGNTAINSKGNLFVSSGGTVGQAAGTGGQISFGSWLNGDLSQPYPLAAIRGVAESSTTNNNRGALIFGTMDSNTAVQERMRISSSGNIGIANINPLFELCIGAADAPNRNMLEIAVNSGDTGTNIIQNYNRATAAYTPLNIAANTITFGVGTAATERMRITSGGKTLIGITSEQNAGRLQLDSGTSENGGILDIAGSGWYRYYTRVCRNSTAANAAGYWHIKTNIVVNTNVMFMAKFYGYIYGSAQILDLTHAGYAYSGSNTVINQATTNNGSEANANSVIYASSNGNKVTFRIAFGTSNNFSTYFAGVMMDMAFPSPAGQGHDFEIEAQTFSTSGTVY
jgi:hypothetical protein